MPHILQDYDDYFLAALIRSKKGSLQATKILLENFNGLGYRYPKVLGDLDPLSKMTQDFLNATCVFPLPKRTEDGSLICLLTPSNNPGVDLSDYNWYGLNRFWLMSLLVIFRERVEGNIKAIMIYDCSNEKLTRFKNITPSFVGDLLQLFECCPTRIQGVHFINLPSFLEPFVNLAKTFTKNKLIKRLSFHRSLDTLYEKVPKILLPKEYGGCEANVQTLHDSWREKVESYREEFIKTSDKMRKLDPLRHKSENGQEMEGTFRQLHID